MSFKVKVISKEEREQNIYCDSASYDNAQKLAEKIAAEQINALCQELGVEKKKFNFDFDESCYCLKISYKDNFTRLEKIIKVDQIIYKKDKK